MNAVILPFNRAARCHAEQDYDALMRRIRLVARGCGCTVFQVAEVEGLAQAWHVFGVRGDALVQRARKEAIRIAGPRDDGPRAA